MHNKGGRIEFVLPMLAKRVPKLPDGPAWSYELKFDGYRMEALKDRGSCLATQRITQRDLQKLLRPSPS